MRIFLTAIMALAFAWAPAQAQETDYEARMAVAREIVESTGGEAAFRVGLEATLPMIRQSFAQSMPTATNAQLDEVEVVMMDIMMETYPEISEAAARMYSDRFTLAELQAVMDFNRTPVGQKFASATPSITREMAVFGERLGQQAVMQNMARIQAVFQ